MKKFLEFAKNHIVIISILVLIIILIITGIFFYIDSKRKQYYVEEVSQVKYYELKQNEKYGIIDTSGNIIIEPQYDNIKIPNPEKGIFICKLGDKNIALNENGQTIFSEYDEIDAIQINGIVSSMPYEKTVLQYKQHEKYGLIDFNGKKITKPIYEEISGLTNKESELLVKENGKYGVINSKGAKLVKTQYDNIVADGFYTNNNKYALSGYIVCNKTTDGYRYGYINSNLKLILNVEYSSIERILETDEVENIYLIACKNGRYGVTNNGKELIGYEYQNIEYDNDNKVFRVQRNDKVGLLDKNSNVIIPIEYSEIDFKGIYLQAVKNDKDISYFDKKGNKIDNVNYTSILGTKSNDFYITINEEGKYGILDGKEQEIISNKYSYIEYLFGDYFIVAKEDGKLGIINKDDVVIIDLLYDVLQKVEDTNVIQGKILKENKSDLYSDSLEKICSMYNAYVYRQENYIKVYSNIETQYFDLTGKKIENTQIFNQNKLFSIKKDDKWGYKDINGNIVVECIYDEVTEFNEYGFAGIKLDNKWGIINQDGTIIVEPVYEIEQTSTEPEFLGKYYKVYYGYGQSYFTDQISE